MNTFVVDFPLQTVRIRECSPNNLFTENVTHVSAGYEYNCRDISSLAESSPILGALHLLRCHLLLPHGDSRYL